MRKQYSIDCLIIIIGALFSCYIGFHNKFPLVYPDTGTYVLSGFTGVVPVDRPIIYGLFIRYLSLGVSPWLVIFCQGLLTSWLLHLTLGMFLKGINRNAALLASIVFLTLTTGYSYNVSILMPDILSATSLLCLVNILFNRSLGKLSLAFLFAFLVLSASAHFSSPPIILGLVVIIGLGKKYLSMFSTSWRRLLATASSTLVTLLLVCAVNLTYSGSFSVNSASHVFIMNHLVETGILKPYLDEVCDTENHKICEYKDDLSWNFIWNPESPFRKTGGWEANRDEYNSIIFNLIATPKYWPILGQKTAEYGFKQFFTFQTTVSEPQLSQSSPGRIIPHRFKDAEREYLGSLQNTKNIKTDSLNYVEEWIVLISMIVLIIYLLLHDSHALVSKNLKSIIITVFVYSLISSFLTANISTVEPRYQNRIIWLFPFVVVLAGTKYLDNDFSNSKTKYR